MSQISVFPKLAVTFPASIVVEQPTGSLLHVTVDGSALPTGASTSALQTAGNASLSSIDTKLTSPLTTKITDGAGVVTTKTLGVPVTNSDVGLVTNTVIHGLTTGGGGGFVDVKVSPSGALTVDATVSSSALPTGAATEATLSALNAKVTAVNTGAVVVSSSVLPTGAATETTLASVDTKIPSNLTVSATRLLVDNSGVTQPISAASLPLPTGAATETTLSAVSAQLPTSLGAKNDTGSLSVVYASNVTQGVNILNTPNVGITDGIRTATLKSASTAATATDTAIVVAVSPNNTLPTKAVGLTRANAPVWNIYSLTNVNVTTYVQLIASTTSAASSVSIFDSSGQAMILATGPAGSEVDQLYIPPGGDTFNLAIPAGTRVSIKALTDNATSGHLLLNLLG